MSAVPKVNEDYESKRLQRNMTNTQKRNSESVKEGKIVNAFVKDTQLDFEDTLDTFVISRDKIALPEKVFEKEEKKNNGLLKLAGISVGVMALFGGFTAMIKSVSKKKLESTEEYLLPGITRNHCINNEVHQSIFSMIQSPNRKTVLASVGVITLAAMAFMLKTFVDGFKEVWVKRREADIQKNLQENLIAVETQSFSGKIQIIRSMLSSKAESFSNTLKESAVQFKGAEEGKENKTKKDFWPFAVLGGITVAAIVGLGYFSMRNIRKSEECIKNGLSNTREGLKNIINEFNSGKGINPVKDHEGKVLEGKAAYKHVIENMLESVYAEPSEIEETIGKMNLPEGEKKEFIEYLQKSMNRATEKANSAMGGSGRNKITYFSHVNDYLSFFYDWLMNPKNPQFKNLFFGITGISALGYGGKLAAEAVKEVQVKKYNADIELNLQKRLVSTELRNFKAKKESIIEPLCDEFERQKEAGRTPEELKNVADNILFEIKNGPPFVYA